MIFFGRLSSLAVTLQCAAVLLGGWLHSDWLPVWRPSGSPMEASTAFCLALAGAALLIRADAQRAWRRARFLLAASVLFIAAASLFAAWYASYFPADALFLDGGRSNGNGDTFGMAPQVAGALLGIGVAISLLGTPSAPLRDALMHSVLIISTIIGVAGMIGHTADLPFLHRWSPHSGIDLLTAVSLVLLAFSSSIAWRSKQSSNRLRPMQPRIMLFNVLWAGLFGIGFTAVVVFARTLETMQIGAMEEIVRMQSRALREELEAADIATDSIAGRPYLVSQLQLVNQGQATDSTIRNIRRAIDSIVVNDVEAMAIYSLNGALVARLGDPERKFEFELVLDHTHRLLWNDAPMLRRTIQMMSEGQLVATAVVDVRLPNVRHLMTDAYNLGPSAETAICGAYDSATAVCMPQRHRAVVSRIDRVRAGKTLPIGLALDGQGGTTAATDYRRQQVIATYAPIATYPLGIVTKIDRSDLSAPIRENLAWLAAGLNALLIASIFALYFHPRRMPVTQPAHFQEAA